jgi:hypothetical protein
MDIHRPNCISIWCMLLGHTGRETESGFHVCSRCGLHEYHCAEDYAQAGLLQPWLHLHWLNFRISLQLSYWRWEIEALYDEDDFTGIPF